MASTSPACTIFFRSPRLCGRRAIDIDAQESMSERVRVYVNSRPVDVDTGGTMLDAVHAIDMALGAAVDSGDRALTDSRGLPLDPRAVAYSGAIIRVVGARGKTDSDSES